MTILGEDDGSVVSLAKSTVLSIVSSFLKFDRWTFRLKQDQFTTLFKVIQIYEEVTEIVTSIYKLFLQMVIINDDVYKNYVEFFDNEPSFIKIGVRMIAVYNYTEV